MFWRWKIRKKHRDQERREQKDSEEGWRQQIRDEKDEYDRRLKEFRSVFKCHVCGKPSARPYKTISIVWDGEYDGNRVSHESDDWTRPDDLVRCSQCQNWTCQKHLEEDLCKKCGEKL